MQHDQMVIDFGFLTNTGNSKYWESDDSTDNVFQIWIGIEFSDHQVINSCFVLSQYFICQDTYHDSIHNLTAVLQIADTILSVDQPIQYSRPTNRTARMKFERPMLNFTLAMVDAATKIYQKKYFCML